MKKLPPIAVIMIVWAITAIPLYKVSYFDVHLANYTLYLLMNIGFFFGYLQRDELGPVVKVIAALVLAFWCVQVWRIFSELFPMDLETIIGSSSCVTLFVYHTFLIAFLTMLSLCPILVGMFGNHAIKMAAVIALPTLFLNSPANFDDTISAFLSLCLFLLNLFGIMFAIGLSFYGISLVQWKSWPFIRLSRRPIAEKTSPKKAAPLKTQ